MNERYSRIFERTEELGGFPSSDDYQEGDFDPEFENDKIVLDTCKRFLEVEVIGDEWMDDHLPCFNLKIKTDAGILRISYWWADSRTVYRAEAGKDLDKLFNEIMEQ